VNETFVDDWMQILESRAQSVVFDLLQEVVDDMKELISTPVTYIGSRAIRSAPGSPPYRETGELMDSIRVVTLDEHEQDSEGAQIVIGAVYARALEYGRSDTINLAPRPFIEPTIAKWVGIFAEYVGERLVTRF
jgi:hypothetical protein